MRTLSGIGYMLLIPWVLLVGSIWVALAREEKGWPGIAALSAAALVLMIGGYILARAVQLIGEALQRSKDRDVLELLVELHIESEAREQQLSPGAVRRGVRDRMEKRR